MRKRFIVAVVAIVMTLGLFTGCGPRTETIYNENATQNVGSYAIFQTQDAQEYLKFLENFDETKYEIVNISTSLYGTRMHGSDEFYMVTYKVIEK